MIRRYMLIILLFAVLALPAFSGSLAGYTPDGSFRVNTYSISDSRAGSSAGPATIGMHSSSDYYAPRQSSIPLAARNLQGGTMADQTIGRSGPRRTIIYDDDYGDEGENENLHPDNPPLDPYFTPVGDIPWLLMLVLCMLSACASARRSKQML